jgi:tetratricopeptide (TPR) repeat protein
VDYNPVPFKVNGSTTKDIKMVTKKIRRISPFLLSFLFCLIAQTELAVAIDGSAGTAKIKDLNDQIVAANEARDLPAAIRAAEEAVRVAQKEIGPQSLKTADAMNNLANLYMLADRASEAQRLYQAAILIDLEKMDAKSIAMADIYYNLGIAYAVQEKHKAAIDILRKAREIYLEKQGPDDLSSKRTDEMITELTRVAYPEEERL